MDYKDKPTKLTRATPLERLKFDDLIEEVRDLGEELKGIAFAAYDSLESEWFSEHTQIFPRLCVWKEEAGIGNYSTFGYAQGEFHFKPLLSDANSYQFHESISKKKGIVEFEKIFGQDAFSQVEVALASQEMQIDFANKLLVIPMVLFEKTCGCILAKASVLTVEDYAVTAEKTSILLDSIRKSFFHKHKLFLLPVNRAS